MSDRTYESFRRPGLLVLSEFWNICLDTAPGTIRIDESDEQLEGRFWNARARQVVPPSKLYKVSDCGNEHSHVQRFVKVVVLGFKPSPIKERMRILVYLHGLVRTRNGRSKPNEWKLG